MSKDFGGGCSGRGYVYATIHVISTISERLRRHHNYGTPQRCDEARSVWPGSFIIFVKTIEQSYRLSVVVLLFRAVAVGRA